MIWRVIIGLIMDYIAPRDTDFEVDLESGETVSEEDGSKDPVSSGAKQAKVCSGFVSIDGSIMGEDGVTNVSIASEDSAENVKLLIEKKVEGEDTVDLVEKKQVKEKRKKTSAKKPPRPPRGPSLDAADQKLIKEISDLAMLKRARIGRMKALKKMKAAKASSSSNGNLFAMLFTIFFCLVIIFQGMSSRSSPVTFQESSRSAGETGGGLISVQYYRSPSASNTNGPSSGSPNLVEQVSGSDPEEKAS